MNILNQSMWYNIARNEYRLVINTLMPNFKRYFFPIFIGIILFYPTVIMPWILDSILDENTVSILDFVLTHMFDIMYLNIFVVFLSMPISLSLKDIKIGNIELLLSAPTKSSDVLLGEFFGKLPFYMTGAILIGGVFTGIFSVTGTDFFVVIALTLLFVLNFLLAYWIGTVVGFYIRGRILKSVRMKDLGKALSFLIIIPFVFVMYGTMGIIMNYAETSVLDANLGDILLIFPSTWIAKLSSQLVSMSIFEDLFNFDFVFYSLLIFGLVVCTIIGGMRLVNRIYNLEPASLSESSVKPHNITYKAQIYTIKLRNLKHYIINNSNST